jgi:hypothetical protein
MWHPDNRQWWILVCVAVGIVLAWPPSGDRSLAMKLANWAVDPGNELPMLPPQLGFGAGDDPDAVAVHDAQTQYYDSLYARGGWTRRRLELKDATDPLNPATERQVLVAIGVITAFIVWRMSGEKTSH